MSEPIIAYEKELESGIYRTRGQRGQPFWRDGRNVVFEEGAVKSQLGQYSLFFTEVNQPITGIKATIQAGVETVYYGTPDALLKWTAAGGVLDLSRPANYSGTDGDLWSFGRWGAHMVASNGVDPIQIDRNDGEGFVDLDTPFDWAKVIYTTDTQLIAFNTSDGGEFIAWTDVDDIEEWTTSPINQAGEFPVRNLDSGIIGVAKLGSNLAVYTKSEMIGMSYVGVPAVFSILPLLDGVGITSKAGAVSVDASQYLFGRKGISLTDGTSSRRIDDAVRQTIYGDSPFALDLDYAHLVVGWHDELQTSVTFYYPTKGSTRNNIGVSYNYSNQTFTFLDYGRTFVDQSGVFPFALSGDRQGNIFQQSVVAAPPQGGEQGFLDLSDESFTIESTYGSTGYGEFGYGG